MLKFLKHTMRFGHQEFERMTAGIEVWERQGFHDRLGHHTTCLTDARSDSRVLCIRRQSTGHRVLAKV